MSHRGLAVGDEEDIAESLPSNDQWGITTMCVSKHRKTGFVWAALLTVTLCPAARADDGSALDEIRAAWLQRQETTRSFRFVWTQREFRTKAWNEEIAKHIGRLTQEGGGAGAGADLADVADLESSRTIAFTVDGSKIRYVDDGPARTGSGEFWQRVKTTVYDGSAWTTFAERRTAEGRVIPQANIMSESTVFNQIGVVPLLWAYRMAAPDMQAEIRLEHLELTDEPAVHSGQPCLVLRGEHRRALWVAAELEHHVVRVIDYHPDATTVQAQWDVGYARDAENGWVPSTWRFIYQTTTGEVMLAHDGSVLEYGINALVPPSEFQLDIPPDTLVVDSRDPDNESKYIQRSGGRVHPVNTSRTTYTELLESVRQAEASQGGISRRIAIGFAVVAILGLVGYWLVRIRARS